MRTLIVRTSFAALLLVLYAAGRASVRADVVTAWNDEIRQTIRTLGTNPPTASRAMAMMHSAMFDAVNSVNRQYAPYLYTALTPGASAEAAAAQAAHDVMVSLFPSRAAIYDGQLATQLSGVAAGAAKTSGITLGSTVAAGMLANRTGDGSTAVSTYTVAGTTGLWRPTPAGFANPLLPQWGDMTPFAIPSTAGFLPAAPPALNSPEYFAAVQQVKEIGSATSATRTADQTQIAQFWADGGGTETPPGHWNRIAQVVSASQGLTLSENARVFAMMNLAMADAGIVAWDAKYTYDLWRPITAIRQADEVPSTASLDDDNWTPLLATPPFPEYISGHSTFSAAAAAALAAAFGTDNIAFTVGNDFLVGVTRSFTGFNQASLESGISRIYGGIHFAAGNENGYAAGIAIGEYVAGHYFQPVPEPAAVGLIGAALATLVAWRRRVR